MGERPRGLIKELAQGNRRSRQKLAVGMKRNTVNKMKKALVAGIGHRMKKSDHSHST